jgi:hypothetical protein
MYFVDIYTLMLAKGGASATLVRTFVIPHFRNSAILWTTESIAELGTKKSWELQLQTFKIGLPQFCNFQLLITFSVCLSACLSAYLSVCLLSVYLSACLSVGLTVCLPICLYVRLSVCLCDCLSV